MNSTLNLILRYAVKSLFTFGKPTPVRTILNILMLLLVLLYGFSFSYLVKLATESEKIEHIFLLLKPYIYGIFFGWNLLKGIFPIYSKYNEVFAKAYPLSILQKNGYEFLMSAISLPSLSVLVFFLPAILRFNTYSLELALATVFIFVASVALNIVLRRMIHVKTRFNSASIAPKVVKTLTNNQLIFNNFWRKPIVIIALFVALLFKTVMLSILIFGIKNGKTNSDSFESLSTVFSLFASPLIFFTYVFNNVYGILPQPIRWFSRQENVFSKMFGSYLYLLTIPLIIDIIITFSMLFYIKRLDTSFMLNYFILTFFLILNGFLGSIYRPMFVKAFFANFKGNTDMLISFISILILGCVFFLNGWYKIAALLGLLVAFLFYFKFIKKTMYKRLLVFNQN
jgi:hypothetical protein